MGKSIQILILLLVVSLVKNQNSTINCHYSCQSCVGQYYTLCTTCVQPQKNITVVQDPNFCQPQFLYSNIPTGLCTGDVPPKANALGIVILIICVGIALAVRTSYSMYLISTLQTISLISFVQIAWVTPVGYLLQSLQYFMVFNYMGSGYKVQDHTMRQRLYYRLNLYAHQSGFLSNIAIVGLLNIILVILIIVLGIWKHRKDKQKRVNKFFKISSQKSEKLQTILEPNHESQIVSRPQKQKQNQPDSKQKILQTILKVSLTAFYFAIQQTSLVIMISLRFQRPITFAAKAIPIIYCICLLAFLIYIFLYPLWFFPNKQTQYVNIWRKMCLPVLVIVPLRFTFLIVVGMLIFSIFQSFFDYRGGKFKLLSRITLFKFIELIVILLAGIYIITQLNRNLQISTNIIRVFLSIAILVFLLCFFVQLVFGLIEAYCLKDNQVQNLSQLKQMKKQQTIEQINVFDGLKDNKNIITIEQFNQGQADDLNDINTDKLRKTNKQKINVQKVVNSQHLRISNTRVDKDNTKNSQNTLSTDPNNLEQEARRKKKQNEQQAKSRERERERKKKEQQQQARKKKLQQQEQARKKKLQELQALKKQQEQQLKRKKRQEEQRKRRQQQQRKRKQEQQRIQKEEQQREKRKKRYAQMDPELRKRYGF